MAAGTGMAAKPGLRALGAGSGGSDVVDADEVAAARLPPGNGGSYVVQAGAKTYDEYQDIKRTHANAQHNSTITAKLKHGTTVAPSLDIKRVHSPLSRQLRILCCDSLQFQFHAASCIVA